MGCSSDRGPLTAPSAIGVEASLQPNGTLGLFTTARTVVDFALCLAGSGEAGCYQVGRSNVMSVIRSGAEAPGSPLNLTVTVTGNAVTLVWSAPASGGNVSSYVIEAGSFTGGANLASIATNSVATTFSASGIGPGTYFVRVRGQNVDGTSPPSNEVIVVVGAFGCIAPPGPPTGLSHTVSGSTVTFSWAGGTGCSATSYILQAGSGPGLSNFANFNTGNSATTYVAAGVGSGTYVVRVLAANPNGVSGPSNEISLRSEVLRRTSSEGVLYDLMAMTWLPLATVPSSCLIPLNYGSSWIPYSPIHRFSSGSLLGQAKLAGAEWPSESFRDN